MKLCNILKEIKANINEYDVKYAKYSDKRYDNIINEIQNYSNYENLDTLLNNFKENYKILLPFIKIRNWKSQVPIPEKLDKLLNLLNKLFELKNKKIFKEDSEKDIKKFFYEFLDFQGINLPMVSAILHFFLPNKYPIIDKITVLSCKHIYKKYLNNDKKVDDNILRIKSSFNKKVIKYDKIYNNYIVFKKFIDYIRELCNVKTYREMDKILFLYYSEKIK